MISMEYDSGNSFFPKTDISKRIFISCRDVIIFLLRNNKSSYVKYLVYESSERSNSLNDSLGHCYKK